MLDYSSVSFTFTVDDIAYRAVPVATSVSNEFDWMGTLLGLPRLPGEKNTDYKERLLDVFVNRANSTYTGLINGMTRELGLELFEPIEIRKRSGVDPTWAPRIEFKDNIVYIWSDYNTQTLEMEIDRGNPATPEYFIGGLIDAINTSTVFMADYYFEDDSWANTRSDTICNQSSSVVVEAQPLAASKYNYLGIPLLDRGSLVFSDTTTFMNEVDTVEDVTVAGQYHVDYATGLITSHTAPSDDTSLRYSFLRSPFVPKASPVIIRSLYSPEFQKVMFNQVVMDNGETVNGTATIKGAAIINELMSVVPMYWGP